MLNTLIDHHVVDASDARTRAAGAAHAAHKRMRVMLSMLVMLLASACFAGSASATVLKMDTLYAGEYPSAPTGGPGTPWLTATLTYTSPGSSTGLYDYTLTLQSYLSNNEFVGGANKNIGWAFSLADTPSDVTFVSGTQADSIRTSGILTGPVPLRDAYNLAFYWDANRFTTGSSATYTIQSRTDPSTSFFALAGGNVTGLYSAAHVQGITNANLTCSVWIVNSGTSGFTPDLQTCGTPHITVSEPSELPLVALGLTLILASWFAARRRSRP